MNRLCAAVLLFAVLFCLPRSAGAGEPLAAVSESELARIVHEGDGRPLVLVYWASWCVPCRTENPLLVDLAEAGTVPIYGINYKDDAEEALGFLEELGDPFTRIGADRSGRVAIDWGVYGVPETYIIDAEGRIAYKHVGPFDQASLEEDILPVVRRLQAESDP